MNGLERLPGAAFVVHLHPSKLASPRQGIRAHLNSLLLRYNEELEGVILSFSNERVLTHHAAIQPYFPFVKVEVLADVVLFRARQGMRLVGTVNKVGADYIGLLVLGFINASLGAEQIRSEFRPRLTEQCWASSKTPQHRLEVGTKVHFSVHAVRHHGQFVSIAGSLQQPGTGADGFAKPPLPASAAAGAARGQQQQGQQEQRQQLAQQQRQEQQQQQQPKAEKRKKKRKVEELAQQQPQAVQAAAPPPPAQQQQAEQPAAAGKKAKKDKQKQQTVGGQPTQQNGGTAAALPAGAAAAQAPEASAGKNKGKKRKAEAAAAAPTPAAAKPAAAAAKPAAAAAMEANGSSEQKKKKKKKTKD